MNMYEKFTYNISSLHDKLCFSIGHQLFKHICEVLGDLLEGKLDGFMFALLQYIHQLHNGIIITIKLLLPFSKFLFPLREADKLLQSLLVHMAVLLELSVGLVEFLPKLRVGDRTKLHSYTQIESTTSYKPSIS